MWGSHPGTPSCCGNMEGSPSHIHAGGFWACNRSGFSAVPSVELQNIRVPLHPRARSAPSLPAGDSGPKLPPPHSKGHREGNGHKKRRFSYFVIVFKFKMPTFLLEISERPYRKQDAGSGFLGGAAYLLWAWRAGITSDLSLVGQPWAPMALDASYGTVTVMSPPLPHTQTVRLREMQGLAQTPRGSAAKAGSESRVGESRAHRPARAGRASSMLSPP